MQFKFQYRKCQCGLSFQPVSFIENRSKGYCSEECKTKSENNAYDICMKTLENIYKRPQKRV
jgi:hypothetical protein